MHRTQFIRDQRGAAFLEMALVLPVLMMLGFGAIEFGNLVFSWQQIAGGVRDGARYAAGLPYGSATLPATYIAMTGRPSAPSVPEDYRVGFWTDANTVTVNYASVANDDGDGNPLYRGGENVGLVTVSAHVPYPPLGFLEFLGVGPVTILASHQERLSGGH
jgi:hypothetical protein